MEPLIKRLSLPQKASLLSGRDFWHTKGIEHLGIMPILITDGPHGLRISSNAHEATGLGRAIPQIVYPTASTMAASFDPMLIEEVGNAIGRAAVKERVGAVLGPGTNIKRSPLGGRNFEYYSEDPYLSGKCAAAWIRGVEHYGIGTALKHFAVNNQEKNRMFANMIVDVRALHEIYLKPFEIAVKEGKPSMVMTSYNRINGYYAGEHKELITDTLRNRWGFKGLVVSDWGGTNNRVDALKAGLDLEMPATSYNENDQALVKAVEKQKLSEAVLDKSVNRVLAFNQKATNAFLKDVGFDFDKEHKLAVKIARESLVLLKNEKKTLPLDATKNVLIVGEYAKHMRIQGSGSSHMSPTHFPNVCDVLKKKHIHFDFESGYSLDNPHIDIEYLKLLIKKASNYDEIVVFIGLTEAQESEGFDRKDLTIPIAHEALLKALRKTNKKVTAVLFGGGVVVMPWLSDVDALLHAHLPGQGADEAIVDVLFGKQNPCGKLAESYPHRLRDNPSYNYFGRQTLNTEYRESVYVGYRYYQAADREVLFPFGYGLSYTTFSYETLKLNQSTFNETDTIEATVTLKNTGNMSGKEVVQLYVRNNQDPLYEPFKQLRVFQKVELKSGETKTIKLSLSVQELKHFDGAKMDWVLDEGEYGVCVGTNVNQTPLKKTITVLGEDANKTMIEAYRVFKVGSYKVTDSSFKRLFDHGLPEIKETRKISLNTPLVKLERRMIGRRVKQAIMDSMDNKLSTMDPQEVRMFEAMIQEMPLRSFAAMSQGTLLLSQAEMLVALMNKNLFKALKYYLRTRRIKKEAKHV